MSQLILGHEIQQFSSNIELLSQQKTARIFGLFDQQTARGKSAVVVEQVGQVPARKRTSRYPEITPDDVPVDRPWVFPVDYDWATWVDSIDELRLGMDVKGKYTEAGTAGMNRAKDDEAIAAFFATRTVGRNPSSPTDAFPASQQVGVNVGGTGSDLNVAKLQEAKRLFMANETGIDTEEMAVCVISSQQNDALLKEIQVISSDYNGGQAPVLRDGRLVERFMGFRFVHSERLLVDGSGYRRVPVFLPSGMAGCTWNGLTTDITQLKTRAGLPWQCYHYQTIGAVRKENVKVVEIKCAEA